MTNTLSATDWRDALSRDVVLMWLNYNPDTGIFTWKKSPNVRIKIGQIAGAKHNGGYWHIRINGKYYMAHRLAWLYMTGKWPLKDIDHKDTDKRNNSWINLREATESQNGFNRGCQADNKLKTKGVHLRSNGKYLAQITVNGKPKLLGLFDTLEDASAAYQKSAKEIHGEFYYGVD